MKSDEEGLKLISIVPYKNGSEWYFALRYEGKDKKGHNTAITISKVASPFNTYFDKYDIISTNYDGIVRAWNNDTEVINALNRHYLPVSDNVVHVNTCFGGVPCLNILKDDSGFFWVEQSEVKEMTLDEIEKELGYPVKIVEDKKGRKKKQ